MKPKPVVRHQGRVRLFGADSRDVLAGLPDNSVDSIVTDPPYALESVVKRFGKPNAAPARPGSDGLFQRQSRGFMGETWDTGEVAFDPEFWSEALRVLKSGGHLAAFGGTRTYHRLACAIEDAGFEIRDQLAWVYGTGFPKSHDVAKGIDKLQGATREPGAVKGRSRPGGGISTSGMKGGEYYETAPATPEAAAWEGWGTALKPGWEPICLARKSLVGTVAANVLEHGTGALNIGGCRVGDVYDLGIANRPDAEGRTAVGRFPANVLHDGSGEVADLFPNGAARFFYGAKASPRDRDEGLAEFPEVTITGGGGTASEKANRRNVHPTVKPTDLMRWLTRLITPPGGVVLDPFMGSGSTGKAAAFEGFRFVGVERDERYIPIAEARITWAYEQVAEAEWAEFLGVA